MTQKPAQFADSTLSGNGSGAGVCLDRSHSAPGAPKIVMGRPQTDDPRVPGVPGRRKSGRLAFPSTTKCESLLTPTQAGEFLSVPETTLAQWRSQRRGPLYVKLESRLVRYRRSDLEAYIGQHLVETEVDKAHA